MYGTFRLAMQVAFMALAAYATPLPQGNFSGNAVGPPTCAAATVLVGDGNPHQNYYNIQVTDNLECGAGTTGCSVSHLTSHSVSWSVNGGITPIDWISGGFAVQETFTTGNTYACDASPGQTVCVWESIAHTAYTCENIHPDDICDADPSGSFVILSPNSNDVGSDFYCVVGDDCRSNGAGYWDYNGPAGGP